MIKLIAILLTLQACASNVYDYRDMADDPALLKGCQSIYQTQGNTSNAPQCAEFEQE